MSAAQGKVLYDNQKKITATSGLKTLNSNYGCFYYKNGNSVIITADFANKTVPQAGITLGTLPTSYKPSIEAYSRNGFDNQYGEMRVDRNGVVTLSSSSGAFNYGHFTCSYPAYSNFD